MSKIKLSILSLFTITALILAWLFIPTHTRLGSEITNSNVADALEFKGYKLHSTEPKDGKLHQYYLISKGQHIEDTEPFLITSDPFAKLTHIEGNQLQLHVSGRVKSLNNDLWIETQDGKVNHWLISVQIKHTRAH